MKVEKPVRVLVTGVGAIIGYGIIKSLRASDIPVWVLGMDIYDDAVGQYWCDKFIQAKYAVDPNYISFLQLVLHENKIDFAFFGTEQEIYRIDAARDELGDDIQKVLINRTELLALSKDKWLTRETLLLNGLEDLAIPSVIKGDYSEIADLWGSSFLLKPRSSYASKGIQQVSNQKDFAFYKEKMGANFMAQQLVGDVEHEYTVAAFGLGDGRYSTSIAFRRKLSQEGATAKAETVCDNVLLDALNRLCAVLKPIGPTNFQFRFHEGKYFLLEVNPRISSSTSLRMAFGYNEAELSLSYFLWHEIKRPKISHGRAMRYIDEVVVLD